MKLSKFGFFLLGILIVTGAAQAQFPAGNLTWTTTVNGNTQTLTNFIWTDQYGAHRFPGTATQYRTPTEPLHGGYLSVTGFRSVSDDNMGYSLDVTPYQNATAPTF